MSLFVICYKKPPIAPRTAGEHCTALAVQFALADQKFWQWVYPERTKQMEPIFRAKVKIFFISVKEYLPKLMVYTYLFLFFDLL